MKRHRNSEQQRQQLFDEVMRDHSRKIYGFCLLTIPRDPSACESLYYDILGRVWYGLLDYRDDGHLAPWLYRIASNTVQSYHRDLSRRPATRPLVPADNQIPVPVDDDRAMLDELYRLIDRLPRLDRHLTRLYLLDLPQADIARMTGLSVANVSTRIDRIKKKLKRMHHEQS
ncbi:MAG: RNA polymerase sigma factor [Bacteroidales bacterium]|nr:RNA polymerase sigma factor [Bacteroidales bacterium]